MIVAFLFLLLKDYIICQGASQAVLVVKKNTHLSMQETYETRVRSLGWKDPLEKEVATHSGILAWRIPWTEAWQATVHGVTKSRT